jgi:hypothetical protein
MLKRLLAVFAVALLTLATYAVAQDLRPDHPSAYTVRKGDTLWDIASRFLTKPWLWPEIWQANPQIANPHRIYPGDVISLAYLDGEPRLQVTERQAEIHEYPISPIPLAQIEPFLRDLRILDRVDDLPYVISLDEGRLRGAAGQLIYVRGLQDAHNGDTYAVVRPTVRYARIDDGGETRRTRATDLDWRGKSEYGIEWAKTWRDVASGGKELLGYEVMTQARAQVIAIEGEAASLLVLDEGRDIREGDRLVAVTPQPYDLEFVPHPPRAIPAGARVMAVADGINAGSLSVVSLSIGAREGVENGQVYSIWGEGPEVPDRVKHATYSGAVWDSTKVPDTFSGHVMVFRTFDTVSYGLVMDGVHQVKTGYLLKQPDTY